MADEIDTIALREEALKELAAETTEKTEPEVTEPTPPKAEEEVTEETPEAVETPTEETTEAQTEVTDKPAEVAPEDRIKAYAEKNSLTIDEAKDEIEKTERIIAQYKNDPAEMAKALRNKDREYSKLRAETEKAKPKQEVFRRMDENQFQNWAKNRFSNPTPDMIDADGNVKMVQEFRRKYPAKSEIMTDEAIVEEIIDVSYREYQNVAAQKESEVKESAQKMRETLVQSVPESDRQFIPYVKKVLQEADDAGLLQGEFDVSFALRLAKGERYDADIKEAEERGFKRAQQKATIAGVRPALAGTSGAAKAVGKTQLNDQQKERAEVMFQRVSKDDAYRMFSETYEEELKKNKNFCT